MTATPEFLRRKLLDEFSDRLEDTLVLAITYDRDLVRDFDDIRADLQKLAATAPEEEASGFDRSGLTASADIQQLRIEDGSLNSHETSGSGSRETEDATTIPDSPDSAESMKWTEQSSLTDQEKLATLNTIFGTVPEHTIRFVLREVRGDVELAFDELLSRQFREEEGSLPKGVDGFAIDDDRICPIRGKARARKEQQTKTGRVPLDYNVISPTIDKDDIEGANLTGQPRLTSAKSFTAGAPPSSAKTASRSHAAQSATTTTQSAYMLAAGQSSEWQTVVKKETRAPAQAMAGLHASGESQLGYFTGYLVSDRAEQLVDRQSTASKIDLHGVTVMDGVRIAKSRVRRWWDGLGEERGKTARYDGLYIVTGIGRHSAGGVSRLRQAVGAALRNDGWRFETLTGEYLVTGRA